VLTAPRERLANGKPQDGASGEARLIVSELCKTYPNGTAALDRVSFTARAGEVTVILGPNGSGKSTIVRCVVRLTDPSSGSVVVAGRNVAALSGEGLRQARREVAVIFQNVSLVARRTALANVAAGCLGRKQSLGTAFGLLPKDELSFATRLLERLSIAHLANQRADTLSGGQAQRVAVARVLLQQPSVLLADEPVASLDPDAALEIMAVLQSLAREDGLAVVCVLHQMDIARRFADHIVGLRSGAVVINDRAAQVDDRTLASLYKRDA